MSRQVRRSAVNTMTIEQQVTSYSRINFTLLRICFQRPLTRSMTAGSKCSSMSRSPVQLQRASSMVAPCSSLALYEACF